MNSNLFTETVFKNIETKKMYFRFVDRFSTERNLQHMELLKFHVHGSRL